MPFHRLATGVIAACCAAAIGCAERNEPAGPSESSDDSNDGSPVGDLFVNVCRPEDDSLICSPFRIAITSGTSPHTETQPLAQVVKPIAIPPVEPDVIAFPGLVGSTVDIRNRLVYWHAGCDERYHVTDIAKGKTKTFALDLAALGIPDDGRGLCLGEWVFDTRRQERGEPAAIALVGRHSGAPNMRDKSTIEFMLAVDAKGQAVVVHDLRGMIDPGFLFLHEFQTIAALDPDTDDIVAPVVHASAEAEDQVLVNLATGTARLVGAGGGGTQHRFFDLDARGQVGFNCTVPGWTSAGQTRIAIDPDRDLIPQGITEVCGNGFVGGGYDPVGRNAYLLLRKGIIDDPEQTFLLAVADLASDRFAGFIDTDATYGELGVASVGEARLFLSTEFVPR